MSDVSNFFLRRIDFNEIINKYNQGFFDREIQKKNIIKRNDITIIEKKFLSECSTDPVYCKRTGNDIFYIVSGDGYFEYDNYKKTEEIFSNKFCNWKTCKKEINIDGNGGGYIGIPIQYRILQKEIDGVNFNLHLFVVIERYCCCIHAWERILEFRGKSVMTRNPITSNSEKYFKIMCQLMNPDMPNIFVENYENLLVENGGSLTKEEIEKYKYVKLPFLKTVPTCEEYLRF